MFKFFKMTDKETLTPNPEATETPLAETENGSKAADAQPSPNPEDLAETRIAELQKQLDEAKGKYLYLFSDFENYRRNAAKERFDLMQTAGRDIMAALLPILDDFDRAAKNGALTEGTALIHQKLAHTLRTKGLAAIELKVGDEFNADQQEAVAEIPAASEELRGKIVDILEPGYLLGDKIIRFAKVVVGK